MVLGYGVIVLGIISMHCARRFDRAVAARHAGCTCPIRRACPSPQEAVTGSERGVVQPGPRDRAAGDRGGWRGR